MTNENEIQVSSETPVGLTDPMMVLLERIALSPDLPIERLSAVMDMQERQMNKVAEQLFNSAFAKALAEMPPAKKRGENKHTGQRYSTLSDIVEASRPALSKYGLALSWKARRDDSTLTITAIIRHEGGWKEETSMSAPADSGKGHGASMNAIQAHGSTETYLKRYTGMAILGLSSDDFDDDAQSSESETVSADQYLTLRNLIDETGTDEVKFHTAHGSKSPETEDLHFFPAALFEKAKAQLERKKRQMEAG